jgi:hypothetical protein
MRNTANNVMLRRWLCHFRHPKTRDCKDAVIICVALKALLLVWKLQLSGYNTPKASRHYVLRPTLALLHLLKSCKLGVLAAISLVPDIQASRFGV